MKKKAYVSFEQKFDLDGNCPNPEEGFITISDKNPDETFDPDECHQIGPFSASERDSAINETIRLLQSVGCEVFYPDDDNPVEDKSLKIVSMLVQVQVKIPTTTDPKELRLSFPRNLLKVVDTKGVEIKDSRVTYVGEGSYDPFGIS